MQIKVWEGFSKKVNSTKRPTGGTTIEGYYRNSDPVSILAPVIRIEAGTTTPRWNYCYIPDFNRYYYIAEWTHIEGVWIASLMCDVLASYKDAISTTHAYVLRCASRYNPYIVDTKYPATTEITTTSDTVRNVIITTPRNPTTMVIDPNIFDKPFQNGSYILGIIGPNDTGVTYYSFTYNAFTNFMNVLNDDTLWDGWSSVTTDIPAQYAKAIADPLQFIDSAIWIPFEQDALFPGSTPISGPIKLGYWNPFPNGIGGVAKLDLRNNMLKCQMIFPIRKHPQINSGSSAYDFPDAKWLQSSGFSDYTLVLHPFGEFPLPASQMIDKTEVRCEWYIDYTSCDSILYIYAGDVLLGMSEATFGVPIRVNQQTVDVRGFVNGAVNVAAGTVKAGASIAKTLMFPEVETVTNLFETESGGTSMQTDKYKTYDLSGGMKGVVQGAAQAVGGFLDAKEAKQPCVTSKGGVGTYLPFGSKVFPKIIAKFQYVVANYDPDMGRPYCCPAILGELSGFIQCENAHIDTVGTEKETLAVNQYLNGGFFYE